MVVLRPKIFPFRILLIFTLGLLLLSACSGGGDSAQVSGETDITSTPADAEESAASLPTISQWAVGAEASSVFAEPEWSPEKVLGPPDSPGCGDYQFAWASAASDGIDQLTVFFSVPVLPVEINIHQSFNPDQVVKVEVYNLEREVFFTVLQKNPETVDRPCPYQLSVSVTEIDFPTDQIRITVDQSQLGLGWNEIDAVELVGFIPD
jgi:hypothetical protein